MKTQKKLIRLNKYLALCGLGSRRKVEELITNGSVLINGEAPSLGTKVDPTIDAVTVNGRPVEDSRVKYYVMLNKPKGYLTSVGDPFGRRTVVELLHQKYWEAGVFPVGRLDKDTEGLLLLTNDGELSHRLMHPSFESSKTYVVVLDNPLEEKDQLKIAAGMKLREFTTQPCKVEAINDERTTIHITIHEGKKRQIRVIFKSLHYKVKKLIRISIGPLELGRMPKGQFRDLKTSEIRKLKSYVGL